MIKEKIKESVLFSRLRRGDREAFAEVYDLYADKIYRFIYFKVNNKEEAEDLTSSVFLKVWNYARESKITDYTTFKALIYKIARNNVIDYYRGKSGGKEVSINCEKNGADIIDPKQDLAGKVETSLKMDEVEKKLFSLKDEYREIIVLRFIEGLSAGEIAKILDKTAGNVRVLIYRALKTLRELLEEKSAD